MSAPNTPVLSDTTVAETEEIRFYATKVIPLGELKPNPWNPNEMHPSDYARLVREIRDMGFVDPLIVVPWREENGTPFYRILGGEHRYRAALELKLKGLPCNVLDTPQFQDEEVQQALTAKLIFLKGRIDRVKMLALVKGFAEKYSSEKIRDLFAVTDKSAWDRMVWGVRQGLKKEGVSQAALAEFDEKTKTVRASEDLAEIVENIFTTYRHTLPYGYMVFTLCGKRHTYVPITADTQMALDALLDRCRAAGKDINQLLEPLFREGHKQLQAVESGPGQPVKS